MYKRLPTLSKRWVMIAFILTLIIPAAFIVRDLLAEEEIILQHPIIDCPTTLAWNGIVPGISTRQDVLEVLGNPDNKGNITFNDKKTILYYAYDVEGGVIAEYVQHRIFFRSNGIVDWIEAIIVDSDGAFHTVNEMVVELGNTLDTVYTNNNYNPYTDFQYDVLGGPDRVLVWSECGMAVIALWWGPWGVLDHVDSDLRLTLRYPDVDQFTGDDNSPTNLDGVVMMEFLFQPTTFDSYKDNYMYRVPYGLWDDYLAATMR